MRSAYLISFLVPAVLGQGYYGGGDSTSTTTSAAASPSQSGVHNVQVGAGGKLAYDPDTVTASVGDKINFWFNPLNHSVIQSSFDKPCVPSSGSAIFSGFQPVAAGSVGSEVFTITVNDTKPIWIYCGQAKHCEMGMAMVINQAASGPNTLTAYKAAAANVSKSEVPSQVGGGVFAAASSSSPSASSASSASTPKPSSGGAASVGKAASIPLAIAGGLVYALL